MYQHIPPYLGDPILSLVETFQQDPRPNKINLSIGIYFDHAGKMSMPQSVQSAIKAIGTNIQGYLPMEGHTGFRSAIGEFILGKNHPTLLEHKVAIVQTLGGSGALKLGADFLYRCFPQAKIHISDPTWDNHRSIFEGAGFTVLNYPYYDAQTINLKFDALCSYLNTLPQNDIVLLHLCCHNPTGVDLSPQQWDSLLTIMAQRQLIPFIDSAYQGFADTFQNDAYAIHKAIEMHLPLLLSHSFSKSMSLYGQRIGALFAFTPSQEETQLVLGQLQLGVRKIYSSPPAQGGLAAFHVLSQPNLQQQWQQEVYAMRDRIRLMRQKLYDALKLQLPQKDFSYLIRQRGMFSYTGLTKQQVHRLRDEFAIYVLDSGRLCIAGLNEHNIDYVAHALIAVLSE